VSCLSEATCAVYVDEELGPDERRRVESHLIGCRRCRALVAALRDETAFLADALQERARPAPSPRSEVPAEPGLTWGLPVAVVAVAGILSVAGTLVETRLLGGLDLLRPLSFTGAYEMAFDLVFALRDRAPGLFELVLSLAAVAAVSAAGSFALGHLYRRIAGPVSLALLLLAVVSAPGPASALDVRLHRDTHVAADETLDESLVVSGDAVDVDGVVRGDLVAWAERVAVRGRVEGNVYAFARDLEISGEVGGTVHAVGHETRVDGEVRGSLYGAGESLELGPRARVGRDAAQFGEHAILEGRVARDVVFAGEWLEVRGDVGRNVDVLHADRMSLRDGARVGGDVDAVLHTGEIATSPGAQVLGETRVERAEPHRRSHLARYLEPRFYVWVAVQFGAGFALGLLLRALVPPLVGVALPTTRGFFRALGLGFAVAVVAPVAIALCALTVIGIPVAVLASLAFLTALFASGVVVSAAVGRALLRGADGGFALQLLVGLGVVLVAVHVPFLGLPLGIVTLLTGLGLFCERARDLRVA